MYSGGAVRRAVDGVGSTKTSNVNPEYMTASAGGTGRFVTPLSTPRSSPLPPHIATSSGAGTAGPCRWTHLQPQQQPQVYGVLDDNVEDFALMASLVSATSASNCDDILLKGP